MTSKYYIGVLEFKTKKECENYTRNIINSLGCCIINIGHIQFNFLYDLFRNHSEYKIKKGVGIDYFYIQHNPFNKKYYQTMIKRLDGSDIDFSWVFCCQFKERTHRFALIQCMRQSIKDTTIKYKYSKDILICNFCKTTDELYENFHVDHYNPSFQQLKNNFLELVKKEGKEEPLTFDDCKKYNVNIFKDTDADFKNDWIDYHNKNCNLQILCRDCNLRKKKT